MEPPVIQRKRGDGDNAESESGKSIEKERNLIGPEMA